MSIVIHVIMGLSTQILILMGADIFFLLTLFILVVINPELLIQFYGENYDLETTTRCAELLESYLGL